MSAPAKVRCWICRAWFHPKGTPGRQRKQRTCLKHACVMASRSRTVKAKAPTWTCPVCGTPFIPKPGHRGTSPQKTCLVSTCVNQQRARSVTRVYTPAMRSMAQKRALNEEIRDALIATFGKLRTREIDIFKFAFRYAHSRGYQQGFHAQRRKAKGAAGDPADSVSQVGGSYPLPGVHGGSTQQDVRQSGEPDLHRGRMADDPA